jgi:hypothetical protein
MMALATPVRADTITIPYWSPYVQVDSPIGYDLDRWYTVENPCQRTLFAQTGDSVSSGTTDFAWGEAFGTFLIQSDQAARGTSAGGTWTTAGGNIWLATTQPLSLSISGSWHYSLPADWMQANIGVTVKATDSSEYLFTQGAQAQTLPGEPAYGTLTIQGEVTLTPGHTWVMDWGLLLMADQGTQDYSATGFGTVSFYISPEPATLALLASLLLVLPRRTLRGRPDRQ